MKLFEALAIGLGRSGVTELAVMAGRPPSVKVDGAYQPVADFIPSEADVLELLATLGGLPYIDALGPEASKWKTAENGIGTLLVKAARRQGVVQALFVLQPSSGKHAAARAQPPPVASKEPPPFPSAQATARNAAASAEVSAPLEVGVRGPKAPSMPKPPVPPTVAMDAGHHAAHASPAGNAAVAFDVGAAAEVALELETHAAPLQVQTRQSPPRACARSTIDFDSPMTARPLAPPAPPYRVHASAGAELELEVPAESRRTHVAAPAAARGESALFRRLLGEARQKNASDLHIVATRPALFRVAGELVAVGDPLDAAAVEETLFAIVPPRLRATFDRDGSCDFAVAHPEYGRFRVNVSRQRTGLKASLRLIGFDIPTLASLGLPAAIGNATHHHQGLIVLTGPTGHGKTSTLAALVDLLNSETTHHIITVEDPVEYVHPRKKALVTQREVGTQTRSFATALKASLREDPDVIVVGELRDTETVRMALAASETGHLVIATMNTPSAAKTIDRLIDLFPPGDQPQVRMGLAGGLRLVVSQRLVRSVDGKSVCAAAEVLPGSVALWNLIRENKTYQIPSLQQRGKALGIVRLDDSLADLVRAGKVTLEEARAYAEASDELTYAVTGQRSAAGKGAP